MAAVIYADKPEYGASSGGWASSQSVNFAYTNNYNYSTSFGGSVTYATAYGNQFIGPRRWVNGERGETVNITGEGNLVEVGWSSFSKAKSGGRTTAGATVKQGADDGGRTTNGYNFGTVTYQTRQDYIWATLSNPTFTSVFNNNYNYTTSGGGPINDIDTAYQTSEPPTTELVENCPPAGPPERYEITYTVPVGVQSVTGYDAREVCSTTKKTSNAGQQDSFTYTEFYKKSYSYECEAPAYNGGQGSETMYAYSQPPPPECPEPKPSKTQVIKYQVGVRSKHKLDDGTRLTYNVQVNENGINDFSAYWRTAEGNGDIPAIPPQIAEEGVAWAKQDFNLTYDSGSVIVNKHNQLTQYINTIWLYDFQLGSVTERTYTQGINFASTARIQVPASETYLKQEAKIPFTSTTTHVSIRQFYLPARQGAPNTSPEFMGYVSYTNKTTFQTVGDYKEYGVKGTVQTGVNEDGNYSSSNASRTENGSGGSTKGAGYTSYVTRNTGGNQFTRPRGVGRLLYPVLPKGHLAFGYIPKGQESMVTQVYRYQSHRIRNGNPVETTNSYVWALRLNNAAVRGTSDLFLYLAAGLRTTWTGGSECRGFVLQNETWTIQPIEETPPVPYNTSTEVAFTQATWDTYINNEGDQATTNYTTADFTVGYSLKEPVQNQQSFVAQAYLQYISQSRDKSNEVHNIYSVRMGTKLGAMPTAAGTLYMGQGAYSVERFRNNTQRYSQGKTILQTPSSYIFPHGDVWIVTASPHVLAISDGDGGGGVVAGYFNAPEYEQEDIGSSFGLRKSSIVTNLNFP